MACFTEEIRKKIYSEIGSIITTYFANTTAENLELHDVDPEDYEYFFEAIRLHSIVMHITRLKDIIKNLNQQVNRDVDIEERNIVNNIRGRLDVRKYGKYKYFSTNRDRVFPCLLLRENYDVIENRFIILVIRYVFELIEIMPIFDIDFQRDFIDSGQLSFLMSIRNELYRILHSGDLRHVIQELEGIRLINIRKIINERLVGEVEIRLQRRMINPKTYGALLEWWKELIRLQSCCATDIGTVIGEFLLYRKNFDDKLFELWVLEGIKKTMVEEYGLILKNANPLWKRRNEPIFELIYENGTNYHELKIYFQKSKGLVWDDGIINSPKWLTYDLATGERDGFLGGNLDIIITCDNCESYDPIFIDAKNIFYTISTNLGDRRNSSVTDKIYKMVGYLDNFNKFAIQRGKGIGILIFRNSTRECILEKELISEKKDASIAIFSTDPMSKKTFGKICKQILNHFDFMATRIRLEEQDRIRKAFKDSIPDQDESEKEIITVQTHVISIVNILLRGKETEIDRHGLILRDNRFGEPIWNWIDCETKRYLAQAEYLLASLSNCSMLEYSSIGVLFTKSIELELNLRFTVPFRDYMIRKLIPVQTNRVLENIRKGKHVALGQIARVICPDNPLYFETIVNNYFCDEFLAGDTTKMPQYIVTIKKFGEYIKGFAKYRNDVAHKDGIDYIKFCEIRNQTLGIGRQNSIIIDMYDLLNP